MAKSFKNLKNKLSPESQNRIDERIKIAIAKMPLAELRQARKITQQQLAETLKIKQASISKIENQTDMYISTMRKYIQAMGGELEIIAKFPDGSVKVDKFEGLEAK
jgi:DNA-binding XRE family transcriptional regulator